MGIEHDILVALENSCIEESRTIKPKGAIEWSWRKKLYDNVFKVFPDILDQGKTNFRLFCAVVFAAQMELNVERAKLGETCNIRFEWKSLLTRFLELHGYKGGQGEQEKNELVKNLMNPSEAIYVYRDAVPWCFKCLGVTAEIDIANSDDMVQARVKSEIDYGGSDPMLHAPVMGNSGGKMTSALEMSFKYFWRHVDSDLAKRLEKSSLLNKNQAKTKTFVNLPLSGYKRYEGDHRLSKGEILYYVEKGKAVVVTILVGEQFHYLGSNNCTREKERIQLRKCSTCSVGANHAKLA